MLAYCLVITMVVAVAATTMLQLAGATIRRQASSLDTKRAFYLAEAGLAEAYSGLMIGKTGNVGSEHAPAAFGEGVLWVEARALDADRIQLDSVGMCGLGRAELSIVAERGEQSVASLGLFAHGSLAIPAGAQVIGYDSSSEDPLIEPVAPQASAPRPGGNGQAGAAAPATPLRGRIGSNGDIAVAATNQTPTTIHADLGAGPGHATTLARNVTHVGASTPRAVEAPLPPIEAPFAPDRAGITHSDPRTLIFPPGSTGLEFLKIASGAHVVVQGPGELVLERLDLARGGELEFDTKLGLVSLWVLDGAELSAGSSITTTSSDASRLVVQAPSDVTLALSSLGDFHGVVYAPKGEIRLGADLRFFGAAVADRLVLAPGAKLYFDRNLDAVAAEASLPMLLSWRLVEMSSASHAGHAREPYALLGVDAASLVAPSRAHQDQPLEITYENLAGATVTYSGLESAFDWTKAKKVHALARSGQDVAHVGGPLKAAKREPASDPGPPPSAAQTAIDSPGISSRDLAGLLIAARPLSSSEIVAAIQRPSPMTDGDLKAVLVACAPLGASELRSMLDRRPPLVSASLKEVLVASSPLPPEVVSRIVLDLTLLNALDRLSVLGAQ